MEKFLLISYDSWQASSAVEIDNLNLKFEESGKDYKLSAENVFSKIDNQRP